MKKCIGVFIGLLVLMLSACPAKADTITANSTISKATVYPGAARVTRTSQMTLTPGTHSVVFEDIIPLFDENSITVSGEGQARVKILGAYMKQEHLQEVADRRVNELQQQIEKINDKLAVEQANEQVIFEQKDFLQSLKLFSGQQLPKDLVTKMPTTVELGDMIKFIGTTREGLEIAFDEIRKRKRALTVELQKLQNELAQYNNGDIKLKRSIVVDLECAQAGSFKLDVSYMLNGAFWYAVYDAHSYIDKNQVELISSAMVKQTTGEDWKDIQLTLSTAQPALGGRMPFVAPWILSENVVYPQEARGIGMMRKAMVAGVAKDSAVQYEAFKAAPATLAAAPVQAADVNYAQANSTGVSVTYQISRPVTLLSDGNENKFPVQSQTLKADFEYSAYPRSSAFAYLGSRVVNANDIQLLAGPVNLFLGNEFVGKSSIDAISPGQDFDLYLGVDENVKVKREQIERKVDDTLIGGIQSPNRKTIFKYKLSVENFASKPIAFKLFDSVPVSENDKIRVKIYDVSVPPTTKDWKDRKGVWLWELKLNPKEKKEIFYSFIVEHPRDINVGGI